ncbi:MAG: M20/M25/M40 family metallo-hydrolase [Caulobacter sp.]|nr:M20/M25/M40 family metallo-hydrolase [Caulobacter sp.]
MGRMIALATALAGALLLGWLGTKTPTTEGAPVPAGGGFHTPFAMTDIQQIAARPHPAGSVANASVRDYLMRRMSSLGLQPAIQTGLGVRNESAWILAGQMENIVGVLPGRDRSLPALALMAHYDSVPASPGAADDATGAAVILDVIRALKAKGTPARDVVVILTDGEEAGLLGAELFFAEHPLRKRIGLLINLESRGGGGRANMFQTGPGNGALIPIFAKTAVSPISNSLAVFLYETMPNDTDFTVSNAAGVRGLNYAFIGRQFDYHSPTSTPANLDRGSVRHMGEQTLAAASALAFADTLPSAAPDAVYSQTFGDQVLAYPAWGGWIALLVAAGLIGLAFVRGRRSGELRLSDAARGAGAALFLLLAGALLLHLARLATGVGFGFIEQRPLLARWGLWELTLAALGLGLLLLIPGLLARERTRLWLAGAGLTGGLLCLAFGGWDPVSVGLGLATAAVGYGAFGKPAALPGAWLGVLLTGLAAGLALQAFLPAVAFLVVWPLVLASLGAAVSLMGSQMDRSRTAAVTLLAAFGGGWLAVFFHVVSQGLDQPMILALFLWLGAFLVWPLAWPGRFPRLARLPAVSLLALGLALLAVVRFGDPWTARHPEATVVLHVQDATTGKAWRVAPGRTLPDWSRAVLTADGGEVTRQAMPPLGRGEVWAAPAKALPVGAPPVTLTRLADGRIEVGLPAARVSLLTLTLDSTIPRLEIDGRPVALADPTAGAASPVTPSDSRELTLRFVGRPVPHRIILTPTGPGRINVRYGVFDERWPAGATPLPARPVAVMPLDLSDSSVVTGSASLTW